MTRSKKQAMKNKYTMPICTTYVILRKETLKMGFHPNFDEGEVERNV